MDKDKKSFIIAVDSGGTFVDCVLIDNKGVITTTKAHSTPHDFSIGIIDSLENVAGNLGLSLEEVLRRTEYFFGHGSTVAVNALINRSGVKAGIITTRGFEDTMIMGRVEQKVAGLSEQERIQVYRLNKAEPIVPRFRIKGVTERVDSSGREIVALNLKEVKSRAEELVNEGVEAIAVCLLWSFMNPSHEQKIKEIIHETYPHVFVTISSDLTPVIGEYERMCTTTINAYLSPLTSRYLSSLNSKLRKEGLERPLLIMQNIGGMVDVGEAQDKGVNLLSSGPVGGVLAAKIIGDLKGYKNIISTDVGGTSFDVSLIVEREMALSPAPVFSQYTIQTPVIDINSIGAGGGSIARVEKETGLLKVGPQSAGAFPGPVCYDRGGEEPTFTDANVILGRIDPLNFLGGRMRLNADKARFAIQEKIAKPLGIEVEEAALGIVKILTSHMADLVRKTTIDRGYDPADFILFSFGGAGPLCSFAFASLIEGMRKLVVPAHNSVFSAFGMAGSDIVLIERHSEPMVAPFDAGRFNEIYKNMEEKIVLGLKKNNVKDSDMILFRGMDARYWGQVYEITLNVPGGVLRENDMGLLIDQFRTRYENRYGAGTTYEEAWIEAVTFEVKGVGRLNKPSIIRHNFASPDPAGALRGRRDVYFEDGDGFKTVNVYVREKLNPGNRVQGPAIIEAVDTTVLLNPHQEVVVDEFYNLVADL